MIELENSKELQKQLPFLTEKKLSQLILVASCVLATQQTNLNKCAKRMAKVLGKPILFETAYRRLITFFCTGLHYHFLVAVCVLTINTLCQSDNCYLLLDRTNWKCGKVHINFLVIGLLYRDVFIPLVWHDLGKAGNSNAETRLQLVDRLVEWWAYSEIPMPVLHIAGDREFVGFHWLRGLEKRSIQFVMRIRANFKIQLWFNGQIKDRKLRLKIIRRYLNWTDKEQLEAVLQGEYIVKLTVFDNDSSRSKAEHIYLMTNMKCIKEAAMFYRKRYKIEVCFKHLKKCGFQLEDINLSGSHKKNLMFAVLNLVYLMTIQQGIVHFEEQEPQQMKTYRRKEPIIAPAKSVFLQGLEDILAKVFTFEEFIEQLFTMIRWKAKSQNPLYQHHYT